MHSHTCAHLQNHALHSNSVVLYGLGNFLFDSHVCRDPSTFSFNATASAACMALPPAMRESAAHATADTRLYRCVCVCVCVCVRVCVCVCKLGMCALFPCSSLTLVVLWCCAVCHRRHHLQPWSSGLHAQNMRLRKTEAHTQMSHLRANTGCASAFAMDEVQWSEGGRGSLFHRHVQPSKQTHHTARARLLLLK